MTETSTASYKDYPRPTSPYYEVRSSYLSQGDLISEVPFGVMGPELLYVDDLPGHILQRAEFRPGLILSPTCDFRRHSIGTLTTNPSLEPYGLQSYVLVAPVFGLEEIVASWEPDKRENNRRLMLHYDAPRRYMYLPPVEGLLDGEEMVVDFTRSDNVAIALLSDLRIQQLTFEAAQQLQYKIAFAMTRVYVNRNDFDPPMD